MVLDDLVDVFAIDPAPALRSDPKAKSKSTGVISVLDISGSFKSPFSFR